MLNNWNPVKKIDTLNLNLHLLLLLLLFMLMGWDYVSELWPPIGLLFIHQMKYAESWWNYIDGKTE
jgi:hypothetical protein